MIQGLQQLLAGGSIMSTGTPVAIPSDTEAFTNILVGFASAHANGSSTPAAPENVASARITMPELLDPKTPVAEAVPTLPALRMRPAHSKGQIESPVLPAAAELVSSTELTTAGRGPQVPVALQQKRASMGSINATGDGLTQDTELRTDDPLSTIQNILAAIAAVPIQPAVAQAGSMQAPTQDIQSVGSSLLEVASALGRHVTQPLGRSDVSDEPAGTLNDQIKLPALLEGFSMPLQGADVTQAGSQHRITPSATSSIPANSTRGPQGTEIDLQQLDALVRDISEITSTVGKASFRMSSENLGQLDVRLQTSDAGVSVNIRTETETSHAAVSQAQKQLTEDMRANGLKVADTSVALNHGGAERDRSERSFQQNAAARIEAAEGHSEPNHNSDEARPAGRFA